MEFAVAGTFYEDGTSRRGEKSRRQRAARGDGR